MLKLNMKCYLCHTAINPLKSIIYECKNCRLAIIENKKIPKDLSEIYNFKNYHLEEKKHKKRFTNLMAITRKFMKKGKVLDVGGGFGLFSKLLAKTGQYKIEVIEPSVIPHYLSNINYILYKTSYEKFLNKTHKKYDGIIMLDILEHFKSPLNNLKKTLKILNENGFLIIQTPNYQSLMAKICKNWSWWMLEDHKYLFSQKSIKIILEKSGYKIVYFKTYEDFFDFKKNLDGNFTGIKNIIIRRTIKLIFFSLFFPFYFFTRSLIWDLGYGGLIFLIARKYNNNDEKQTFPFNGY